MRLNSSQLNIALVATITLGVALPANAARETIQIAGSSTVLPYASIVAESLAALFQDLKHPLLVLVVQAVA